jgi:D-glutamate cyclase
VKNDELSYNLGDTVDRLISVQYFMSGGGSALTRKPVTGMLYEAAREKAGAPLCHLAAKALADNVQRGDTVLITTGLIAPPYMIAEGDGPIAAATLARAIDVGLDATPIIVCEGVVVKAMEALCQAAGLMPSAPELAVGTPRKVIVLPFPLDDDLARREAIRLLDQFKPKAVVAIEKLSKNAKGIYHNGFGIDVSSVQAKVDYLFDFARDCGIPTIGVGDGGNEIGTACIADAVRKVVPTGAKCGCPCESGSLPRLTPTIAFSVPSRTMAASLSRPAWPRDWSGPKSFTVKLSLGACMRRAQPWVWWIRSPDSRLVGTTFRWTKTSMNLSLI